MAKITEDSFPKPTKRKQNAVTDEQIGKALILSGGIQSHAADLLGMSHGLVSQRSKESPYLQEIIRLSNERFLDEGETSLKELVKDKNLGAICFLLKTKGKTRGYSEHVTISAPKEMAQQLEAMLRQIEGVQRVRNIVDISESQE